ncbi:MAG: neutral/alkaline non-lysosomal ceramidase N-terminal domain-containing protein [Verrucomicrobia bacterium]|nr:neutral/alkaline non-lysosomal ceramidase N-terminal domain-containing protein [Verrucomicrobiota bacterium]
MKKPKSILKQALTLLGLIAFSAALIEGVETDWQVGVASVDITPAQPMLMSGYANRKEPFESIGTRLYAKAMAMEDIEGNRGVIITADLIGFSGNVSEAICDIITKATGIKRQSILLNASHTHNGPMVERKMNLDLPEGLREGVATYTRWLEKKAAEVAIAALSNLDTASLWYGRGVDNAVMNRREFTDNGIKLGVNPAGLADRSVPVLRVADSEGRTIAALFGAAAHNTTIKDQRLQINGDYAGYAQMYLQSELPGVQAMFMLGCAGDAAPYPRGTVQLAQEHGKKLGEEVLRVLGEKMKPVHGPLRTALKRVDLPLKEMSSRAELEQIARTGASFQKFYATGVLAMLEDGKLPPKVYNAPFAAWRFGKDLTLVGLSGETCVGYVELTERAIGHRNLWVAGYCNDVYGYLPTTQMLSEGGYETRGLYSTIGLFVPETEPTVMETVSAIARQIGRGFEN